MGNSTGGPARELQTDRILDMLADSVRRETIRYFEAQTEAAVMPLDELVAHLEDEVPHDPARVRLELHHLHLPKLDAFGWADYDARSQQIRYHGNDEAPELLGELLEVFEK